MKTSLKYMLFGLYSSIILGLVYFVYIRTLSYSFLLWDDDSYVFNNPWIVDPGIYSPSWMISSLMVSNWHPLTWLSFSLDYAIFGLSPSAFHAGNVILHGCNSLLFFGVLVWALQHYYPHNTPERSLFASFAAAAFFAVHPQHVEVVAWVSERKELLCFFFSLLSMWMYLLSQQKSRFKPFYYLSLLCFLLALSAKAMAVTLPILFWLYDWQQEKPWLANTVEKIPYFALSAVVSLLTLQAQKGTGAVISLYSLSVNERLLNASHSIWMYFQKFLFPVDLSPYYSYPLPLNFSNQQVISALIFIPSATVLATWFKNREQPLLAYVWIFYLIGLLPILGLIQVGGQAAADRYAYWPTLSFYVLIAVALLRIEYYRIIVNSGCVLLLFIFSLAAHQQSAIWKNDLSLWSYAMSLDQKNVMIHLKLADAFMEVHRYDKALDLYQRALRLTPESKHGQLKSLQQRLQTASQANTRTKKEK